jgi:aldehyde dehydrogenase (NAD+)
MTTTSPAATATPAGQEPPGAAATARQSRLGSTASMDRPRFLIGGQWVQPATTQSTVVLEAATEERLAVAALGSERDVDQAVQAARAASDRGDWTRSTPQERADVMNRLAAALERRGTDISELVSRENGMPIGLSLLANGDAPVALLRLYAETARTTDWEELRPSQRGVTHVRREPVGVVGAITPWNFPPLLAMAKVGPALAAGCTVVLKHSPEAALDTYLLGDAAQEAGLPPGVLNIVLGDRDAGRALVTHPDVDKISFTGSTAAGRWIGAECGRLVRRVSLELGGKSAAIVLDDADLDVFLSGIQGASMLNNGQTCSNQTRILAPRSRYPEVVDAVAAYADGLRLGDPLDPDTTCGPVVSRAHRERVLGYIQAGRDSTARLVTGGGAPANLARGWFVEPTVFADVDNADTIAREEIFGPVLVVTPYDDDADAVRLANDSNYGLAGSVWTTDEQRGLDVARRVRAGTIGVNYYQLDLGSPAGGMKDSGLGREFGPEAVHDYVEYKSIYARGGAPVG